MSMTIGDARGLPADALEDLRRRVVAAVQTGTSQSHAARVFGVSRQTVGAWVRDYRTRGDRAFQPNRRGRRPGEQLALTPVQQAVVAQTVARHTPDQVDLPHLVWTRQAVAELIDREFGVSLGLTTVGNYLVRWGFPNPQALLRDLRGRSELADGAGTAWIAGAEAVWVGHMCPEWTVGQRSDVRVLQAVSNRGAAFFLACADPQDGQELRAFLDRLVEQVRRRINVIVSWRPANNFDALADIVANSRPNAAVRFVG